MGRGPAAPRAAGMPRFGPAPLEWTTRTLAGHWLLAPHRGPSGSAGAGAVRGAPKTAAGDARCAEVRLPGGGGRKNNRRGGGARAGRGPGRAALSELTILTGPRALPTHPPPPRPRAALEVAGRRPAAAGGSTRVAAAPGGPGPPPSRSTPSAEVAGVPDVPSTDPG